MFGFNPDTVPWWHWVVGTFLGTIVFFSLVVPDPISIWLAERRNGALALLPIGVIAFLLGGGNLVYAVGHAVWQALQLYSQAVIQILSRVRVEPWVWWALLIGLVITLIFLLTRLVQPGRGAPQGGTQ